MECTVLAVLLTLKLLLLNKVESAVIQTCEEPNGTRIKPRATSFLDNTKDFGDSNLGYTFESSGNAKMTFKCYAEFPVQWVFDNTQLGNDTARNPVVTNLREFRTIDSKASYLYRSHMVFWYDSRVRSQILSCEAVTNPCHRRLYLSRPIEEGLKTEVRWQSELNIPELKTVQAPDVSKSNSCRANFYYGEIDTEWGFCCKAAASPHDSPGLLRQFGQMDAMSLENFERRIPLQPSHCAIRSENFTSICGNATSVIKSYKSYALTCTLEDDETEASELKVMKVMFSIGHDPGTPAKIYWNWKDIQEEDMIKLDLPNPVIKFENYNFTVKCLISLTYFSYGGFIAVQDSTAGLVVYKEDVNWETAVSQRYREPYNAYEVKHTVFLRNTTQALYCFAPVWNTTEWANKSVLVKILAPEPLQIIDIRKDAKVSWEIGSRDKELKCTVRGKPISSIRWEFKGKVQENKSLLESDSRDDTQVLILRVPEVTKGSEGFYTCKVTNYAMMKEASVEVDVRDTQAVVRLATLSTAAVILVLVLIAGLILLWRKNQEQEKALRLLTPIEIKEFQEGATHVSEDDPLSFNQLPYNKQFEVSRSDIIYTESDFLDKGEFGLIYKGELKLPTNPPTYVKVAVKTVPKNVDIIYLKALLSELKILSIISTDGHPNVVRLIGACTDDIDNREVFAAIELCSNGSLKNYLEKRRQKLDEAYENVNWTQQANIPESKELKRQMTELASRIADGMEFLASKNIVHGDIAARNILLDDNLVPKVADFGLARILAEPVYVKSIGSKCPLPWRWMAIESLEEMKFSVNSDIWAYGVLLWEIFSLAQTPYAGVECNPQFLQSLKGGMRCIRPGFASAQMHDLMCDCWKEEPTQRPPFPEISSRLLILATTDDEAQEVSPKYVKYEAIVTDYLTPDSRVFQISSKDCLQIRNTPSPYI